MHSMQYTTICMLSFCFLTTTDSFMHSFLADDSAVFPVLPNAS